MTPDEHDDDMQSLPVLGSDSIEEDEITVRDRVLERLRNNGIPARADIVFLLRCSGRDGKPDLPHGDFDFDQPGSYMSYLMRMRLSVATGRLASLGNTVDEELEQLDEMRGLLQDTMERPGHDEVAATSN